MSSQCDGPIPFSEAVDYPIRPLHPTDPLPAAWVRGRRRCRALTCGSSGALHACGKHGQAAAQPHHFSLAVNESSSSSPSPIFSVSLREAAGGARAYRQKLGAWAGTPLPSFMTLHDAAAGWREYSAALRCDCRQLRHAHETNAHPCPASPMPHAAHAARRTFEFGGASVRRCCQQGAPSPVRGVPARGLPGARGLGGTAPPPLLEARVR